MGSEEALGVSKPKLLNIRLYHIIPYICLYGYKRLYHINNDYIYHLRNHLRSEAALCMFLMGEGDADGHHTLSGVRRS